MAGAASAPRCSCSSGAALVVAVAGPVVAAVAELVHIVLIVAAVTGGLVLAAGAAYATVRVHRWRTRGTTAVSSPAPPPWRPVQARTAPRQVAGQRPPAIEHHIHLHGLGAADVAAIIRHQQEGR